MLRHLPFVSFIASCALVVFMLGLVVAENKIPPYQAISNGAKTLTALYRDLRRPAYVGQFERKPTDVSLEGLAEHRFQVRAEGQGHPEHFLLNGGLNEFLEHCPEKGCVALEVDRNGDVLHAYPYRPDEIFAADVTEGSFYREAVPTEPERVMRPLGVQRYDNGDLLITFQSVRNMFPFASGVARVDRDGQPVWFRFDYSHHWATLLPDGTALVPSLRLGDGGWSFPIGPSSGQRSCSTERPQLDELQILDGDGNVLRTIDIFENLKSSNWSAILGETTDGCDPLHLNYAEVIGENAGPGLTPGDLILSLRNLSAFAIADFETGEIKQVVRGSFIQQHSVQHYDGSKFLLFDNWGGGVDGPPSRLLEVDVATGEERRIFPLMEGPNQVEPIYSVRASHLDISDDLERVLVSFSENGKGFEVEIATGKILMSYESLHDISTVTTAAENRRAVAARADLFGMNYVTP